MKAPPDICGFKPSPAARQDSRWVAVKDAAIGVKVQGPSRFSKAHALVNDRVTYVKEPVDVWAKPDVTWRAGHGDCEDFAILKRAVLKASGIPDEDLFFVIAWDAVRREYHAFLIARQGSKEYILDVPVGLKTMYPVSLATDYRPWAAFTDSGSWIYE